MMLKAKQKGFTLLELLVVITLLAILAVGALVAYDGLGDTAQATAASTNIAATDRSIRQYRAVALQYPDQWDNLVAQDGTAPAFLAPETKAAFGKLTLTAGAFKSAVNARLANVGITALQTRDVGTTSLNPDGNAIEPNLQHSEGATGKSGVTGGVAGDMDVIDVNNISVLATAVASGTTATACNIGGAAVAKLDASTITVDDVNRINVINDKLEGDECNFVVAVGFGHDAAHSTGGSRVAISQAPTFVSKAINPTKNYARYVALFLMGTDAGDDGSVDLADLRDKPTLLNIVDTAGNTIDESIADMTADN